jgi:Flp pilus assembly pilin Flp
MKVLLRRLILSDQGQDVIEYALLTGGIGIAAIATWPVLAQAIGLAYIRLDTSTQNLWEPLPPVGAGS